MHLCNGLPCIAARIETFAAIHAHCAISAANTIQIAIESGHTATATTRRHIRHRRPFTDARIKALHRCLIVDRIEAAHCINAIVQHGESTVATSRVHCRARAPYAGQRVVAFHAAQARCAVIATAYIQQTVEGTNA